jgi:hypothetical protein
MHGRWTWPLLFLGLTSSAFAQDDVYGHSWRVMAGPVLGQAILGSEDARRGQVYYIGKSFYSRRLSTRNVPGQVVVETYFNNTLGGGFEPGLPKDQLHAFGLTAGFRFYPTWVRGHAVYAQIGWGLCWGDTETKDLDSRFNSTPYVALGTTWAAGAGIRGVFEIRYFHMSNAGLVGHNQGSNQIQYLLGIQF